MAHKTNKKTNSHQIGVRVTIEEELAIRQTAEALSVTIADLLQVAAVEAAHRMGLHNPNRVAENLAPWGQAPLRESSARQLVYTTLNPYNDALIHKAAEVSAVSMGSFIIGSTLAFIARHKRSDPRNPLLRAIKLSPQYS